MSVIALQVGARCERTGFHKEMAEQLRLEEEQIGHYISDAGRWLQEKGWSVAELISKMCCKIS